MWENNLGTPTMRLLPTFFPFLTQVNQPHPILNLLRKLPPVSSFIRGSLKYKKHHSFKHQQEALKSKPTLHTPNT